MRVVSFVVTAQTFDPSRGYYHDNVDLGNHQHIQLVPRTDGKYTYIMHAFCDVFCFQLCITDFRLDYMHS